MHKYELLILALLGCSPAQTYSQPSPVMQVSHSEEPSFSGLEHNLKLVKEKFPDLEELIEKHNIEFNGFEDKGTLKKLKGKNVDIVYMLADGVKNGRRAGYVKTVVSLYVGESTTVNDRHIKVNNALTQLRIIFSVECADRLINYVQEKYLNPPEVIKAITSLEYAKVNAEKSLEAMRKSFAYQIDILPEDFISMISTYVSNGGAEVPIEIPLNEKGFVQHDTIKWVLRGKVNLKDKKLSYTKKDNRLLLDTEL